MLIASIGLMIIEHQSNLLTPIRQQMIGAVLPMLKMVDMPYNVSNQVVSYAQNQNKILEENTRLNEQNLALQGILQKMYATNMENKELRTLLNAKTQRPEPMMLAEVLHIDSKMHQQQIIIDKGSLDKVYVGQSVVDANGIVGMISEVTKTSARVLMVSDLNFAIPVQNYRSGIRQIAEGTGIENNMIIRNVSTSADIQVGDTLISSGLGGYFSPGFLVAKVQAIRHTKGQAFMEVDLKPTAKLEQNRYILLVWNLDKKGVLAPLNPIIPEFKPKVEQKVVERTPTPTQLKIPLAPVEQAAPNLQTAPDTQTTQAAPEQAATQSTTTEPEGNTVPVNEQGNIVLPNAPNLNYNITAQPQSDPNSVQQSNPSTQTTTSTAGAPVQPNTQNPSIQIPESNEQPKPSLNIKPSKPPKENIMWNTPRVGLVVKKEGN